VDQLFCMRVFTRVAELGSFARASEDLEIARPTATQAVARLEKRLGVRLVHRTTRRLSLTEDGRAFYEGCVRILGDLAETEDSLSRARVSPRGRLRVTTPHSFVHLNFFPALPRFLERYPNLDVEVFLTDRAVNLVEEGIDCAIRATELPDDSTLVARHVANVHWITCAAPAYLEARGLPKRIEDLERHNCIRFISQSTGRTVDWRFDEGGEKRLVTPRGNLGVTSLEAAADAAARGIGLAQLPDPLAFPGLRAGTLRPVLLDFATPGPSIKVVYPSNRYLTAKVRVFADFVAEIFPSDGWWPEIAKMARKIKPARAAGA
jgi:LysR family transcriptional regulator for bpeEF and oprC